MNAWQCQKRLFKAGRDNGQFRETVEVSLPTTAALYGPAHEQRALIQMLRAYTTELAPTPTIPPVYSFRAWGRTVVDVPARPMEGPIPPVAADFVRDYLELVFGPDSPHTDHLMERWAEQFPADFVDDGCGGIDFRPGAIDTHPELAGAFE